LGSPKPLDTAIKTLLELKVIEIKNGKYVYSSEFEKTADELKKHPPGMFESAMLAKEVDSHVSPALVFYAQYFKTQKDIKSLSVAYIMLVKHLKRLGVKADLEIPVIYATYYFNRNELSVES
jgi:hypothetical protein